MPTAMTTLYHLFAALVGLTIGSFLNVVIARVPEGRSVVHPGSSCPNCRSQIRWYDNVPVLSWLVLRGRCRACRWPIPSRYPTVELLTGLLFFAVARTQPPGLWTLALLVFVSLLVAATYIDLDHWIIPHVLTWPGIAIGLAANTFSPGRSWRDAAIGVGSGFLVFALVGWFGSKLFKKEALGQGDWWFLAMIGAFLGWQAILPVILLSSLQGALVGGLLMFLGRRLGHHEPRAEGERSGNAVAVKKDAETPADDGEDEEDDWEPPAHAVPFGPFLALAALEQLFFGELLADWHLRAVAALVG